MVGEYKFGDRVRVVKLNVVFPYPTISEQAFRNGWVGKVIEEVSSGVFVQFEEAPMIGEFDEVPLFARSELEKI